MRLVITLWPHGVSTVLPDGDMTPMEFLKLKMAWTAWQAVDPIAKFIEEADPVQVSTLNLDLDEDGLTITPEHYV